MWQQENFKITYMPCIRLILNNLSIEPLKLFYYLCIPSFKKLLVTLNYLISSSIHYFNLFFFYFYKQLNLKRKNTFNHSYQKNTQ